MSTLVTFWNQSTERRFLSVAVGLGVVLAGVLLIAIGAMADWGWTRLVGAGAISVASVFVGALIGWSDPVRPRVAALFSSWSRTLLTLLTLIMVAPLFAGLVALVGSPFFGGGDAGWQTMVAGMLITLFLLIITLSTVALAVSLAFQGLRTTGPPSPSESNGKDAS